MRVHTTCNVCIRNTSRMWTCHTQHWIDITLNCPSEQNGLTNNWQYFCITTQYSKYNQSQLYFILLENFNYIIWQEYIIIKKSKKVCTTSFFLDNTASFVLNSSCVETSSVSHHGCQTSYLNDCFYLKKVTNYKTSTVVSPKHEFLTVIITTDRTCCIA